MNTPLNRFATPHRPLLAWQLFVTFAALLVFATSAQAVQWKWLDAQGKVQYSDRPPPNDVPDKSILKRPARGAASNTPVAAAPASANSASASKPLMPMVEPELEKKKRQQEEADASKRKVEEEQQAKARAENCQKARKYEKALSQGYRFARPNDKGEREVLDEKGIAEEQARAKKIIASDCR